MTSPKNRMILGAAVGLFACALLVLVLGTKRPEILSMGTVAFVAGSLAVGASALLVLIALNDSGRDFSLVWPDRAYVAVVVWCWLSYALSTAHRGPILQPFLLTVGFLFYLLVRSAHGRFARSRGTFWALIIVVLVGIEALHGLRQLLSGAEMKGFFFNANYLAMFLALAVPLAVALVWQAERLALRYSMGAAAALLMVCIILTRCRTALAGVLLVVGVMSLAHYFPVTRSPMKPRSRRRVITGLAFAGAAVLLLGVLAVSSKPMSAKGRILVWKVSLRMFLAHPVLGTGFSSFAGLYDGAQGSYFSQGLGTPTERLAADSVSYAFNDYLEPAVELGLVGFLLFGGLWFFVLKNVRNAFLSARTKGVEPSTSSHVADLLTPAAAGSVLVYMIMSFFYFPSRILPIFLLFNVLLAWVVSENADTRKVGGLAASRGRGASSRPAARSWGLDRVLVISIALACFLGSLVLWPSFHRQFRAEHAWTKANFLLRAGRAGEALDLSQRLCPHLRSNDNFLIFYSRLLLSQGRVDESVRLLERGRQKSSNPYLLEKLAEAYESQGNIPEAISSALQADSVLPWRLTSKAQLAELYARQGDLRQATHYARLVLEIPMKLRTDEGLALKQKALDFWTDHRESDAEAASPRLEAVLLLPPQDRVGALVAMDTAGTNAGQLVQAIITLAPEERAGLGFLLVNMPDRDLRTLESRYLVDNATYAYRARHIIPWGIDVPEDVFLNYVLPYAVAGEHRDDWRRDFYDRFRDTALAAPSFEDAVVDLNRDVIVKLHLSYRERDNRNSLLSPFESIASGSFSCGEASLLLVDACRAVGIPARLAVLRHWAHMAGGHIWVEVYEQGRWHHLVAYDPCRLDRTWMEPFLEELDPAHLEQHVLAASFQRTDLHLMYGHDVSWVDISDNYRKKGSR